MTQLINQGGWFLFRTLIQSVNQYWNPVELFCDDFNLQTVRINVLDHATFAEHFDRGPGRSLKGVD